MRLELLSEKIEREREREGEGRLKFIMFTYCSKHGRAKPMRQERMPTNSVFWRL